MLARREDLDTVRMPGKIAIVLDVLFADLDHRDRTRARRESVVPGSTRPPRATRPSRHAEGSYVLAGELLAETLPGFAAPTPLALVEHGVANRHGDLLDHQRDGRAR